MPWIEVTKMEEKRSFVYRSLDRNENFTQLCRDYGISTKTGYKWKRRFAEKGLAGLEDMSRAPKSHPNQIDEATVCELIRIKNSRRGWGAKKIHAIFERLHPDRTDVSVPSVDRIFSRSGLTKQRRRRRKKSGKRLQTQVQATHANHIWTVDFKGWWYTRMGEKCEPLTVRDHYSRYILSIKILEKGNISSVKRHFKELFKRYGLPEIIRSDNGVPFASAHGLFGLTKLAAWWLSLGISLDRIDPGKPSQNGGHERMHADMYRELEGEIKGDLKLHQIIFDEWRVDFNTVRPHESLGMQTPAEFYHPSSRRYTGDTEFSYPDDFHVRMVNDRGYTNHKGHRIFISNALNGHKIGLKYVAGWMLDVYFGDMLLGQINRINYLFTPNQEVNRDKKTSEPLPMS